VVCLIGSGGGVRIAARSESSPYLGCFEFWGLRFFMRGGAWLEGAATGCDLIRFLSARARHGPYKGTHGKGGRS
jgi:hypothetical protein